MNPRISVVIPMRDEAPNVHQVVRTVCGELDGLGHPYEVICVDDGSTDATAGLIDDAAAADARVRGVSLSRPFGKEAALAAGLAASRGAAVVLLDADLQHPPELIPAMVAKWEEGFDVVEAVKAAPADRGAESVFYRASAAIFYGLMGATARDRLDGSSDFKLLDRQVVDALGALPERNRFFRGLVTWVGFRVARLPFQVRDRAAGTSKWRARELARYAMRNVVSFSSTPLRLVAWLGFAVLGLAVLLGIQTFWNWWRGTAVTGFTTVILAVLGLGGLILLSLGVIAIYLAQMYEEQKARPVYLVRRPRAGSSGRTPTVGESDRP